MDAVRVIPMSGQDRVLCLQCLDDAYYAARERTGRGGDWWYA